LAGIAYSAQIAIRARRIICNWNFGAFTLFTCEFVALLWLPLAFLGRPAYALTVLAGIAYGAQIAIRAGRIICNWNFGAFTLFACELVALLWLPLAFHVRPTYAHTVLAGIAYSTQIAIRAGRIICNWNLSAFTLFACEFVALLWLPFTVCIYFTFLRLGAVIVGDCAVVISDRAVVISDCAVVISDRAVVISDCAVIISDRAVVISDCAVVISDSAVIVGDCAVIVCDFGVIISDSAVIVSLLTILFCIVGRLF
jgi:hypothetical protein